MYEVKMELKMNGKHISEVTCNSLKEARTFLDKVEKTAQMTIGTLERMARRGLVNVDN